MTGKGFLICGVGGVGKTTASRQLARTLEQRGVNPTLIHFDDLRKKLAPAGVDPFSQDKQIKTAIYEKAAAYFLDRMREGKCVIVDCGLSVERIRRALKDRIPTMCVVHLHCPLWVAVARDTMRSLTNKPHERGRFLHLRAILDWLNPFKKNKFPQPGITYRFEPPTCADIQVSTFWKPPSKVAKEIIEIYSANNAGTLSEQGIEGSRSETAFNRRSLYP